METIEPKERERIAQILCDNITFSGQVGDYVIHGAIDKIQEEFIEPLRKELSGLTKVIDGQRTILSNQYSQISKLEAENKELRSCLLNGKNYIHVEGAYLGKNVLSAFGFPLIDQLLTKNEGL